MSDLTRRILHAQTHRRIIDVSHLAKRPNPFTIERAITKEETKK